MVRDHLGNEYATRKEMAAAWHISPVTLNTRLKRGWELEKALTTGLQQHQNGVWTDHCGNAYPSLKQMARAYGIGYTTLRIRISLGWELEKALTTPVTPADKRMVDHNGNTYASIAEMARAWGVIEGTLRDRLAKGWDVKHALTTPDGKKKNGVTDHRGNRYSSIQAMCKAYGIRYKTYSERRRKGLSLEEALKKEQFQDHKGKWYPSLAAMCSTYGVNVNTFYQRRRKKWNVEECLLGRKKKSRPTKEQLIEHEIRKRGKLRKANNEKEHGKHM